MAATQRGWAIWDARSETILLRTVSDTAVAAQVNWLCSYAGIVVPAGAPDQAITQAFNTFDGIALVEVEVAIPITSGMLQ